MLYIGIYRVYRVRVSQHQGYLLGGPYVNDFSMRGSILESSY